MKRVVTLALAVVCLGLFIAAPLVAGNPPLVNGAGGSDRVCEQLIQTSGDGYSTECGSRVKCCSSTSYNQIEMYAQFEVTPGYRGIVPLYVKLYMYGHKYSAVTGQYIDTTNLTLYYCSDGPFPLYQSDIKTFGANTPITGKVYILHEVRQWFGLGGYSQIWNIYFFAADGEVFLTENYGDLTAILVSKGYAPSPD